MKQIIKYTAFILLAEVLYVSCKKEKSCENCKETNKSPIAIAGSDQVITLPTDSVSLNGSSSSDPDGKISEWLWTKISGPASFTIIKPADSTTKVKALVTGTYQFELKVTDNGGLSAKDTMSVIVDSVVITNHPPVANAGSDQTITLPTNTINLDGSGSTDLDNNITSYTWVKISGPISLSIANSNAAQTQINNLVEGVYQFELKVIDAGGLFSKDTVQVIVDNTIQTSCPFQQTFIGTIPYRSSFAIATAGNKIVFAGGYEIGNPNVASSRVDIFDMGTQTWSGVNLTSHSFVTIAVGDKIYFVSSSIVDIYNTTNNSWSSTQLNGINQSFSVVKVGNKILILDDPNYSSGSGSTKVHIYDLSFSSGSVVDIQHPLYGVHAFGNKAIFEADSSFDIYDASSNSWSTHPIGENYRYWSAATLGNKIYLAGGYDYGGNNFTNNVHIYDAISNAWSSSTMSQPKSGIRSVGAGGKIFWAGGYDSIWVYGTEDQERYVNDIEIYDVATGVHSHHNIALDGMLYGGYGVANSRVLFRSPLSNELHIYNLNSETWSICTANLGWYVQTISIGNAIYVAGAVGAFPANLTVWKLEF